MAVCSLIEVDQCFKSAYCLHHQGHADGDSTHPETLVYFHKTTWCHIPEGCLSSSNYIKFYTLSGLQYVLCCMGLYVLHGMSHCSGLLYSGNLMCLLCHLGGVVVSLLATGPKDNGFKRGWGNGLLRVIKICSTPSFGWGIKPEAPCHKTLQHVKSHLASVIRNAYKAKFSLPSSIPPTCSQTTVLVGLPESSGWRVGSFRLLVSSSHFGSPR
jgi:hypothetical protein